MLGFSLSVSSSRSFVVDSDYGVDQNDSRQTFTFSCIRNLVSHFGRAGVATRFTNYETFRGVGAKAK